MHLISGMRRPEAARVSPHPDSFRMSFPHMSQADLPVWLAFLRAPPAEFTRIDYDVALAGSAALAADVGHEFWPMWQTLLKKRVDAVAWEDDVPWLIEVKPTANMQALGQVLSYHWLAAQEYDWAQKARPVVVAWSGDPDLSGVFAAYGVSVYFASAAS